VPICYEQVPNISAQASALVRRLNTRLVPRTIAFTLHLGELFEKLEWSIQLHSTYVTPIHALILSSG
jgi:hypothetical protein